MFQSFAESADPAQARPRLERLRRVLGEQALDGFLVPRADEHQGEYVPLRAERLAWLTGFTGSAGMALIMVDKAVIFVDGRYILQVRAQTDPALFEYESLVDMPPGKWIEHHARQGMRIGFDPWLHTIEEVRTLERAATRRGAEMVAVATNPIDTIWEDQPPPPLGPVFLHPERYAGESAQDKLARLSATIAENGADHAVLTDPASLAWTFNIRGSDVTHTPLPLGFALIPADLAQSRPIIFIDPRKLSAEVRSYLDMLAELRQPGELEETLAMIAKSGARMALDPALAADRLRRLIEEAGGPVVEAADPARIPRATKNAVELAGAREAHRRDGAAVTTFLAWLDSQQPGTIDEIAAAERLEAIRMAKGEEFQMPLRDLAFDTISAAGPNGAIIHYRVTRRTSRPLSAGELYLVDSGAQYQDGTTDVTRTVAIGTPTAEMRERYTIVLKGLIAVSRARFPAGTRGCDIDPFARQAHWQAGIDFAHGTGHGVGSYLSVHEGPQRLARTGTQALLAGMILSNEPGYYRAAAGYGIRLENLLVVTPPTPVPGGDIDMHGFETLTLAPFDRRLILADRLAGQERDWLNAYHARVLSELSPHVDTATRAWLEVATAPI
jgi:Xaa-Pro aminopeptidase